MTLNRTAKFILPKFQRQAQAKAGQAKASLKFCFLATLNLFLSLSRRKLSDEDHRLRIWNFKSFAAAYVAARQHIVNAHHVIARLGETRAVLFIGMARRCAFFRASQPAHIILGTLTTMRTRERHTFGFLLFVEKVAFIQHKIHYHRHKFQPRLSKHTHALSVLSLCFPAAASSPSPCSRFR